MACACAAAAARCAALCTHQGTVFLPISSETDNALGLCSFFVSVIAKTCITGNHLDTGSEDGKARLR